MEKIIIPFRLYNTWLGLDIEYVKGIESCGKISFIPNAQDPIVGLMQKQGRIYTVWSLFPIVQRKKEDIQQCSYFVEAQIQDKLVAIPAHEILPVTTMLSNWVPIFRYGLKMFRSLDHKVPQSNQHIQEVVAPNVEFSEKGFCLEEIN